MTVHAENLMLAINLAIVEQSEYERIELHYDSDSAMVAGWKEIVNAIKNKEQLTIKYPNNQ